MTRTHRIAATADLHGNLPDVPSCDVLLIAGDVCPIRDHGLDYQRRWLEATFAPWLAHLEAGAIVGIAGNHDFVAQSDPELMRSLPWTYLCDESTTVAGLTVHGSPWTPTFMDWAFMQDEADLERVWAAVPDTTDVLLTHGPPLGHGDLVVDGRRAGSGTLARRVAELGRAELGRAELGRAELGRLRLHVFGHIHESFGTRGRLGGALVANVSYVDFHYRPAQPPVVFEI